ncbi:MAG: PfkB family carbohydrate kinase, partial [Mariprofundus sp.]
MAVAAHPGTDEKAVAHAMQLTGGGPAANAAVQVARLGGTAGFCGYLGYDLFGNAHVDELLAEGVDTSFIVRGTAASAVSQILAKSDGSRSVVNFKGGTACLAADAVAVSSDPKILLFDGHEPQLSVQLCRWAKEHGVITVLDAGSLHAGTEHLAGAVNYLVASTKFATQWCDTDDMHRALNQLAGICDHVVITRGEHGLLWNRAGECGEMAAFAVKALDSTGAGDAFHGAFALGLARDMAWLELLRFASAAGALACTKLGARCGISDAKALAAL